MTRNLPSWLYLDNDGIQVHHHHKATIKKIFRMAADGLGIKRITQKLNADSVKVIGHHGKASAGMWQRSYVAKLLSCRQVLGEHQPYKYVGKKKIVDGDPIKGYYPVVITDDEWHTARAAIEERTNKGGRESSTQTN